MSDRGVQDGEQPDIARRVRELEVYCTSSQLWDTPHQRLQEKFQGIPPDAVRDSDFFHRACKNMAVTLEMIKCLLDAFPEAVKSIDDNGRLPLHCACEKNNRDPKIVRLLLDLWPESVDRRDNSGALPLHSLCIASTWFRGSDTSSLAILDLLLAAAPNSVTLAGGRGYLPIHLAGLSGKPFPFCKRLIDAYPASLRAQTSDDNRLPIHLACLKGRDVDTVKYMLEQYPEGIDVRDGDGDGDGNLPIHCAAVSDGERRVMVGESRGEHKADIIRCLLANDPDCASKTGRGLPGSRQRLPLHSACAGRGVCLESVRLLFDAYPEAINSLNLEAGGRAQVTVPEVRNFLEAQLAYARLAEGATHNESLLLHALWNGASLGAIKLLFAGNPTALEALHQSSAPPLPIACEFSTVEVVQYLMKISDIRLHTLDSQGDSTLHCACRGGNARVVTHLLETGVQSVSKPSSSGKLPIHLLWESNRVDRNSVEYVGAVWRLLLAHPETVMH